jgi:hypothetical protein
MLKPPSIHYQRRVKRDIERLLMFIRQQPWGNVEARRKDIEDGIARIAAAPLLCPVSSYSPNANIALRRLNIGQIAIIYAYFPPTPAEPGGGVSIRAVRHANERDVFHGVHETLQSPYRVPVIVDSNSAIRRANESSDAWIANN